MEKVYRKWPEGPYGDIGPHLPFEPDIGGLMKPSFKKPCGGLKPSCLGCDPDWDGPDYKPTCEPGEDEEPDEGKSPDVEYDPDGGAYEQQCLYPSLP